MDFYLDYFMNLIREQDLFETKILMGDSKAKVGLSFMYDCPAGLKDVSIHIKIIELLQHSFIFVFREQNKRIIHLVKNNQNISSNGKRTHHVKSIWKELQRGFLINPLVLQLKMSSVWNVNNGVI